MTSKAETAIAKAALSGGGVLRPTSLRDALHLRSAHPEARVIQGGTDLMVAVNFRQEAPSLFLDLSRVPELRRLKRRGPALHIGAGVTFTTLMEGSHARLVPALAEASRAIGSPQIRNRGTVGGNLATASPAGDALPPLLIERAEVVLANQDGLRTLPIAEFLIGPKLSALAADELIVEVLCRPSGAPQTFMKIGPRNAMVISVASLALSVDRERGEVRAAYGSAGPVPALVTAPFEQADELPERVAEACAPIDDVRGTAEYRRGALRTLTRRALDRCMR